MDCSPPGSSLTGLSGQEYWSGLPFPSPGELPDPGIKPMFSVFPTLVGGFFTTEPPGKPSLFGIQGSWTRFLRSLVLLIFNVSGSEILSVMSDSLQPPGLHSPWNYPGQNAVAGSLSLLQGIFPTQGSNPALPHYRQILSQLSHQGSPRILEWVAISFSRGTS